MKSEKVKKPLNLNKNITPVRVEIPVSMYAKLQEVAKLNGIPISVQLRKAIAELDNEGDFSFEREDFPLIEELASENPEEPAKRIPPVNTAIRISASEREMLKKLEELSGKTRVTGYIMRQLIARIIRTGEAKASKLAKKNLPPKLDKKGNPVKPANRFPFMIGERYQPLAPNNETTTVKIISKLAYDQGITISELYRRALQSFSGKIYDETGKLVLACVMLTTEDKDLLEKLAKKHNVKYAAIMRSAIYEEIERCRNLASKKE